MSLILECIGCRKQKIFEVPDPYPVCDDCLVWEEQHFKELHEETFYIRRMERNVVHDGYPHREGFVEKTIKSIFKRTYIPDELRWTVFERDNFTCQKCGSRKYLTIDHIKPVSLGGETTVENSQTLCRSCNSKKGNRT